MQELNRRVGELEKELNIDVVFMGLNTSDVEYYSKRLNFKREISAEELIQVLIRLSLEKVRRGSIPEGDLLELVFPGENNQMAAAMLAKGDHIDHATAPAEKGGVDFSKVNLNLQIKRDSNGIPLPIGEQNLQEIHLNGLVPIILNVQPVQPKAISLLFEAM